MYQQFQKFHATFNQQKFLMTSVRSLNKKQRIAYDTILSWCRNKVKTTHSLKPEEFKPIYLFLSQWVLELARVI